MICHRFSIGLASGEFVGHSRTYTFLLVNKAIVKANLWQDYAEKWNTLLAIPDIIQLYRCHLELNFEIYRNSNLDAISWNTAPNMELRTMLNSFIRANRAEAFVVKPSYGTSFSVTKCTKYAFVAENHLEPIFSWPLFSFSSQIHSFLSLPIFQKRLIYSFVTA